MNKALIDNVCAQVYHNYPEVNGISPKIVAQGSNTLLIFNNSVWTADGKSIERNIRVVMNQYGKIIKTTTSR